MRRAGRNFGASLAIPGAKSTLAALEPMFEMGAEYELGSGEIVNCTNCLFAEVCRRAPIVCRFHAGLLEGLLEHSEPSVSVRVLGFRDPYGCAYMMQEDVVVEPLEAQAR